MGRFIIATNKRLAIPRKPDPRFVLHGVQPRGKYLDKRQRQLCRMDPAFKEALRVRVSNTDRWQAFLDGRAYFIGKACKRCHSARRSVYGSGCYDCLLRRNKQDFSLIVQGIMPPSNHSRDGWLDKHERNRRERSGECIKYRVGQYTAEQFPTGRVRLVAPHLSIDAPDLINNVPAERLRKMAVVDPDFMTLLIRLGWAQGTQQADTHSGELSEAEPFNQAADKPPAPWIVNVIVCAHSDVLQGHALAGPVHVTITTRNGDSYKKALHHLDEREEAALFSKYWNDLPACIRALGDTPKKALDRYVLSKRRGYIRG